MKVLASAFLLFASVCFGQQATPTEKPLILKYQSWTVSSFAHLTATMLDGATTAYALDYRHLPGVAETNPVIVKINKGNNQVFGPGGFGVKGGVWAAQTGLQYWVLRKLSDNPDQQRKMAKRFTIANWVTTALFDAVVIHNMKVEKIIR